MGDKITMKIRVHKHVVSLDAHSFLDPGLQSPQEIIGLIRQFSPVSIIEEWSNFWYDWPSLPRSGSIGDTLMTSYWEWNVNFYLCLHPQLCYWVSKQHCQLKNWLFDAPFFIKNCLVENKHQKVLHSQIAKSLTYFEQTYMKVSAKDDFR